MKAYRKGLLLENRELYATGDANTDRRKCFQNISNNTKNPTPQTQQMMIENCYKE